jgi:glucose/arabinose dehydrogenase
MNKFLWTRFSPAVLLAWPAWLFAEYSTGSLQEKLALLTVPAGFEIRIFAENIDNARQMARGDSGVIFVGSRKSGKIHAITDEDNDGVANQIWQIADGLKMPSGLEFRDGSLYVGDLDRILRYDNIESQLRNPPEPAVITDGLPDKTHHGWKYLRFDNAGWLYVPVGAPCNVCDEPGFAQIRRMRADGSGEEVYASGVRNSVGMAVHPGTGHLWFTDNGRDMMGDDLPADELNLATASSQHFGYPYCHEGTVPDPEFGQGKDCADYRLPELKLGAHVAALGLAFNSGSMFPATYQGDLFIARHGSWNRSQKVGYDIVRVSFSGDGSVMELQPFITGWLQAEQEWGRPTDVLFLPDGSMLVADDHANVIYRITYATPD